MEKKYIDPTEIRKAIQTLKPNGQLFEVRIINGMKSISGYFRDPDTLIAQLSRTDLKNANVYMTLQQVHEGCEARYQWECFVDAGKNKLPTTSDNDIVRYSFIPVDLDPIRPAGISSSVEELKVADEMRDQISAYMSAQGFGKCIQAFSGNGYHLLYSIDEPNNDASKEYVHGILIHLNELFKNDHCKVDTGNYNPARILKLYGTLAQKGRHTEGRPHRMSKIIEVKGFETS